MTLGQEIEKKRLRLAITRADVARRCGVSTQTILNVERDPSYNLNMRLLESLAQVLDVEIKIILKEKVSMATNITMGNDEFILYIRKNYPHCSLLNDQLGKRIWIWIREQDPKAHKHGSAEAVPSMWGATAQNLGDHALPQTATQFTFDRLLLPKLYDMLDVLGKL